MSGNVNKKAIYGVTDEQSVKPESINIDVRPHRRKLADWLDKKDNIFILLIMLGGASWYYTFLSVWILMASVFVVMRALRVKEILPLKTPAQAGGPDWGAINNATGKPAKSEGIFFLGNAINNGKELWLTNSDCRQHFLVLGTTGAGKAMPNDTRVLTPRGWVAIENLAVGAHVVAPDGKTEHVIGVYPQGKREIFSIEFADGRKAEASEEHLWKIYKKTGGETGFAQCVATTQEIAALLNSGENIFVPLVGAVPVIGEAKEKILHLSSEERITLRKTLLTMADIATDADGKTAIFTSEGIAKLFLDAVLSLGESANLLASGDDRYHVRINNPIFIVDEERGFSGTLLPITKVTNTGLLKNASCIAISGKEKLFITDGYIVTHNTESLLGFCSNALSWGSGFLMCDGKGDVSVFAKIYALARRFGREDDLLVLNFMTGNAEAETSFKILSNTLNPFATGSSDSLAQMVVSLMDEAGGDGAMWKGRATAMLTGVIRALCWMRDAGYVDLNVGILRDHLTLNKIMELASEKKYPDMPTTIRHSIKSYLLSLPGYSEEKGEKQSQTTLDQHGFLQMQFTKITGNLADVYGHIFATPYGEVDMFDVVLSRRILFVMLPSLEKSGDEIANLGKIVVANLKGMMGATLGAKIEGSYDEVVKIRPSAAPSPYFCILDEVGYYTVEGLALIAAQVRSLGFSMVYASQDVPSMKRRNEKEAASILANTNTKIFMRIEEMGETMKLAVERGDKSLRAKVSKFERRPSEFKRHAIEGDDAVLEESNRISPRDIVSQQEGEMHVVVADKIVRARSFYANPEGSLEMGGALLRANHFIFVPRPNHNEIAMVLPRAEIVAKLCHPETPNMLRKKAEAHIAEANHTDGSNIDDGEISILSQWIKRADALKKSLLEAAYFGIAAIAISIQQKNAAFNAEVIDTNERNNTVPFNTDEDDDSSELGSEEDAYGDDINAQFNGHQTAMEIARRMRGGVPHDVLVGDDREPFHYDRRVDLSEPIANTDSFVRNLAELNLDAMAKTSNETIVVTTKDTPEEKPEDGDKSGETIFAYVDNVSNAISHIGKIEINEQAKTTQTEASGDASGGGDKAPQSHPAPASQQGASPEVDVKKETKKISSQLAADFLSQLIRDNALESEDE